MQDSEEITKNLFPLSSINVYSPSLVRLQCLLLALYRMVFPVLILEEKLSCYLHEQDNLYIFTTYLIHCGMGRFCFIFLASFCLMRKVLRADIF